MGGLLFFRGNAAWNSNTRWHSNCQLTEAIDSEHTFWYSTTSVKCMSVDHCLSISCQAVGRWEQILRTKSNSPTTPYSTSCFLYCYLPLSYWGLVKLGTNTLHTWILTRCQFDAKSSVKFKSKYETFPPSTNGQPSGFSLKVLVNRQKK